MMLALKKQSLIFKSLRYKYSKRKVKNRSKPFNLLSRLSNFSIGAILSNVPSMIAKKEGKKPSKPSERSLKI
jgi:hypothetical protein